MKALKPLTLKDSYYTVIEAEIRRILDEIIYFPLVRIVKGRNHEILRELKNSRSSLRDAIASGTIWYEDGEFKGRFNAKTSREIIRLGGIFNVKSKTYSLPRGKVPNDLKFAQTAANDQYEKMRAGILSALDNMDPAIVDQISKTKEEYEKSISQIDRDFNKTLPETMPVAGDNPAVARGRIVVEAKLTDGQRQAIARDWGNNLDLYIKKWTDDNILKLRQEIQPHVIAGGRAEGLVKVIQDNYGVSARKAKFLARQETSLLMSKFHETRCQDLGIQRYRWSTAHDKRVRHFHEGLDGKIFRFDQPPITDKKGNRNNPGQDFGCRCVAIALVE